MKKFILGKKVGMTQVFAEKGLVVPVTVIEAGPLSVVQLKTQETDGYTAVKVGFGEVKQSSISKPNAGHFKKLEITPKKFMREFRIENAADFELKQEITVGDMFTEGTKVDVSGISKGKGFAGVIKRHGQSIGPKSHGSNFHRRPGSMGANSSPSRVFKGKKLPGHMGHVQITIQNLEVVRVDSERNLLLIKGAVPGPKGALLVIKETVKKG
ncbi:MAG: 50S ribosomal protein L3 [Bacillota bacterium]